MAIADEWQAGAASAKITPEKPVLLDGYSNRIRPYQAVAQDLFATALVLQHEELRAVILTVDVCGMSGVLVEHVYQKLKERMGLRREQLLVNWSHTHAGPLLLLDPIAESGLPPEQLKRTVAYTQWLLNRLAELAEEAAAGMKPARLSWGSGVAKFVMNRREFTSGGIIFGANPSGFADRRVPVLRVDGTDGRPRAIVFGCAAHNTTLTPANLDVSGDYSGFAREYIEQQYPQAKALFLTGCAGDANPYPRGTMELAREHGTELGREVCRVMETQLRPVFGPLGLVIHAAELPLQSVSGDELQDIAERGPGWRQHSARKMLARLERGEELLSHYRAPVSVWQFGTDLTLVALSGEVVGDYAWLLERALGPLQLWVAAYSHDDFGYLPSARIIAEGGYETRGLSNGAGWFAPAAQDALLRKIRELARWVRRPIPE